MDEARDCRSDAGRIDLGARKNTKEGLLLKNCCFRVKSRVINVLSSN